MEFLWVWAYNMSGPLAWVIGGALVICLLVFAQSMKMASTRSGSVSLGAVYAALVLGLFGAIVLSIPAPTYNHKIVYKDRVVEKPVVKKVVKVRQTITRTITKIPTRDARIEKCVSDGRNSWGYPECTRWAIQMEQPRIIEKRINVHHYKNIYRGVKVVEKLPTYDERLRFCLDESIKNERNQGWSDCHNYAKDAGAQVKVVRVPSKYLDVFKYCNENFSLDGVPNAATIRNERLKICDTAARAAAFK